MRDNFLFSKSYWLQQVIAFSFLFISYLYFPLVIVHVYPSWSYIKVVLHRLLCSWLPFQKLSSLSICDCACMAVVVIHNGCLAMFVVQLVTDTDPENVVLQFGKV